MSGASSGEWTPVSVSTLLISVVAAIPGIVALIQNVLDRPKPMLHATWTLHFGHGSDWVECRIVNLGSAPALDVRVFVLDTQDGPPKLVHRHTAMAFDEATTVSAGRNISGGIEKIVPIRTDSPNAYVRVDYRKPPRNKVKSETFAYTWKRDAIAMAVDAFRPTETTILPDGKE